MDELAAQTGRRYGLVDYHGAPDADRVIVIMGSAAGAVAGDGRRPQRHRPEGRRARGPALPAVPGRRLLRRPPADRQGDRGPRPDQGARRRRRAALPGDRGCGHGADGLRRAAVRRDAPDHRRPVRPLVQGSDPGHAPPGLRRAVRRPAEAPLHGGHLRRRHAPQPADRRRLPDAPARRARSRPSSSASAPTAPSGRTTPPSRSSARAPTSSPRASSSTTPRSRAARPSRTCASGRCRRGRPTSSTQPTSSPATSSGSSTRSRSSTSRSPARPSSSTRPTAPTRSGITCRLSVQRQLVDEADRLLGDRCVRRGRRDRHGQPHQHDHAAVLLPPLRRAAGGRGDRTDQGVRQEDLHRSEARPSSTATTRRSTRRSRASAT